ncbi:hypothetical protein HY947_01880, partial [Candidatus Gottesmanbacteria bacterium]|nr:hypothetical protein [Candidatus Gottesmanbacteria bacterium]
MPAQDILDTLVSSSRLTKDVAEQIRTESLTQGTSVEEILRKKRTVPEQDILQA